jgi:hypothetical protein
LESKPSDLEVFDYKRYNPNLKVWTPNGINPTFATFAPSYPIIYASETLIKNNNKEKMKRKQLRTSKKLSQPGYGLKIRKRSKPVMNNLLPELPPAIDLETKQILKKTITANRKLAELKGIINTIPNAAILINTLYIQEAKD